MNLVPWCSILFIVKQNVVFTYASLGYRHSLSAPCYGTDRERNVKLIQRHSLRADDMLLCMLVMEHAKIKELNYSPSA